MQKVFRDRIKGKFIEKPHAQQPFGAWPKYSDYHIYRNGTVMEHCSSENDGIKSINTWWPEIVLLKRTGEGLTTSQ